MRSERLKEGQGAIRTPHTLRAAVLGPLYILADTKVCFTWDILSVTTRFSTVIAHRTFVGFLLWAPFAFLVPQLPGTAAPSTAAGTQKGRYTYTRVG